MGKRERYENIAAAAALIFLTVLGFLAQRAVPFMMDDEWYGKNLVTEEALSGLGDVVESQIWHFFNWGGRCVTHGILQLTLMCGELGADILNMLMLFALTLVICRIAESRGIGCFLLVHAMIYAWSANLKMSMLWQAGTVNYVYSSAWILLFMLPYLRCLREPDWRPSAFARLMLAPLGLMAGWSNENMGPVCFLLAAGTVVYLKKREGKPIAGWMAVGAVSSFAGSVLVVAAPGNFVRSAVLEPQGIYDRLYAMLTAGVDYLLPSAVPVVVLLLAKGVCLKQRIDRVQCALLAMIILSYGAMVLSPHYPDRATFGTMTLCIALVLSLLLDIEKARPGFVKCRGFLAVCFAACAAVRLSTEFMGL